MKSALALATVLLAIGFVPLMGGPRYEAALVAGLLAPFWSALAVTLQSLRESTRHRNLSHSGGTVSIVGGPLSLLSALMSAACHCVALLAVAGFHGARTGFCEPWSGFGLLLLGPCLGVVLSCSSATVAMTLWLAWGGPSLSRAWTLSFALLFPALLVGGSLFIRLASFYSSPTVFAYDPFVGYFAGPLYDRVDYELTRLLSFRVGTLLTIGSLTLLALSFQLRRRQNSIGKTSSTWIWSPRSALILPSILVMELGSVLHSVRSDELGHTHSSRYIAASLGRQLVNGPCRILFSSGVNTKEARLLAGECRGHLAQLENYFGIDAPQKVDVYLFASSAEKKRYMGAGRTYIAKPWRREIYLQPSTFPHPILGHELAHIVAGQFGQGPLRVAGPLGGLFPDPGRIEGFAVAASPREHSDGTLHEWTAAMHQLGLLPPLGSLFQLSFLQNAASRSYSAAGSFVDFLHQRYGATLLRSWYGGGDLPSLTRSTWDKLESQWLEFLEEVEVPEAVLAIAKPRFSRPGIFERRCPHAVDRAVSKARYYCPVQEQKARDLSERAIKMDPARVDLELEMPLCSLYAGEVEAAIAETRAALPRVERYSPSARRSALVFLGDLHWRASRLEEARDAFEQALALTYPRDSRRQLEVKLWALTQGSEAQSPLRFLLAAGPNEQRHPLVSLARWLERSEEKSLPAYLLARHSLTGGRLIEASEYINWVDSSSLPFKSLRHEALRSKILIACQLEMLGSSEQSLDTALAEYQTLKLSPAERLEASRLRERCGESGLHP